MIWTFLTLTSMVALGSFIAYYGDLQGRRWGKKRVSWFGLRPKHTAILITSLTGAFIVLMSIITLLLVSAPVREVVLRGEAAIRENKNLNAQLIRERLEANRRYRDAYNREQDALQKKKQVQVDLDAARTDYNNASAAAVLKEQILTNLKKREQTLAADLNGVRSRLKQTNATIDQEQKQVASLRAVKSSLQGDNQKLESQNKEIAQQNTLLSGQNYSLAHDKKELEKGNDRLRAERDRVAKVKVGLEHDNDALLHANQAQMDANKQQAEEAHKLEIRVAEFSTRINELNNQYNLLSGQTVSIGQSYLAMRQGKFNLRVGAELARRTIDAHSRPEAVRRELNALLSEASAAAMVHGAARGDNQRAVRIVSKNILTLTGTQENDEDASLNALVEKLAGSDKPFVILANTFNNSVEKEQVAIDVTPLPLRRVLAKNEILASTQMDADQSADKVFDTIVQFLNRDVRDAALKAGTIPQNDPDTGQQRVGSVNTGDLLNLTERIRRMGGKVVLTAQVSEQATSADPLHLTFKLTH